MKDILDHYREISETKASLTNNHILTIEELVLLNR